MNKMIKFILLICLLISGEQVSSKSISSQITNFQNELKSGYLYEKNVANDWDYPTTWDPSWTWPTATWPPWTDTTGTKNPWTDYPTTWPPWTYPTVTRPPVTRPPITRPPTSERPKPHLKIGIKDLEVNVGEIDVEVNK